MTTTAPAQITADGVEPCFVCGLGPHEPTDLHSYCSMSEASAYFARQPVGGLPSMTFAETLDPREAVYE